MKQWLVAQDFLQVQKKRGSTHRGLQLGEKNNPAALGACHVL